MRHAAIFRLTSVALLAACGSKGSRATLATIDTLPGGIVRTISHTAADSGRWQLVEERTVQPAEGAPGELADPGDVVITEDGTVFVVDAKPAAVKMFDPSGALLRTIGREGDGPGEYRSPQIAAHGDTLVAHDPRQSRASMFRTTDGGVIATRATVCCYYYQLGINGAGQAVARAMLQTDSMHPAQGFVRFSLDGKSLDTTRVTEHLAGPHSRWFVREGSRMMMSTAVLLSPQNYEAVDAMGGFIVGWSGEYLLRVTRNGSDTVALFGRSETPPPVSAEDKVRMVNQMIQDRFKESEIPLATLRASFPATDIPDHYPAFERIDVDAAGRRWIRRASPDTMAVHLDLFDHDGRWLDAVTVPNPRWARKTYAAVSWGRDRMALLDEDDAGRPLVRIYRITRK